MTHFHKKCLDRNGIYLIALLLIKFMYSTSICFNNDDEEYTQNSLLSIAWSSKLQVGIDWRNVTLDSSQTNVTVKYKLLNESYFSNITKLRSQNGLAIPGTSSYLKNNSVYIIMVNIGDCKMFTRYVLTGRKTLSTSNNAQDCRDGIYDFLLQPMPSLTWSYSAPSWTNNIPINKDALIDDTNGYKSINSFKQVYANFCIGMSQYNKTFSDGKWININSSPQNTLTKHFSITVQLNSFAYSILAMSGLQVTPSSSSNTNPYSGFNPSISPGNSFGGPNFKFGGMIKKQITGAGNNNNYYYMAMGINQVSGIFSAPIVGSFQITNENMATITGNISYKGYFFGYRAPISYINPNFNKGLSQCGNYSQGTCGKARYSNYCSITEEYADAFCELQPYCYIECPLPFPPINSRETTKSSFTIKWDNFDKSLMQNSSNFCGYTCMYKSSYSTVWLKNISALTTSYSVSDLSSFTTYNVRCKVEAYTMVVSDNYMLINITTNESEPTGEPRNFKGKVVWPSAFNFTWEEVDPSLRNGIVSTYQLICKNEENENSVFTFEFSDPALKGQALNLDYDTMYSCNLAACTAGGCGKKTDSISLKTLSSTPTIFPNVTYAHYINSTSMHIEWEDVDVQLWGVLENRMFCLVREEDGFAPIQNCVNYTTTKLDIHDLIPYTKYDFSVYCKNSRGSGPKDNKRVSAYTDEKAPDVYLLDMEAQEVGVNGLNFSWATPDLSDIHGNITGYTVTATAVISEEDYIPVEEPKERKRRSVGTSFYDGSLQINLVLTINDPSATSVWISDLFGYITYNISAAINNKYNGSFSNGIIVTTEEGTPVVSVLNLQCCDEDQDSITICWDEVPPLYLQGILKNYTVYYRMNDSSLVESIKQDSSETSLRIIMLLPVTKYVFNVTAWTDQGEGVPSGELTCETLEWYPDEEPTDVEVASLNYPNSALVTWEAIPLDDWMGIPAGYQISYKRIMEGVSQMTEDWMVVNSPSLNVSFTLLNLNVFSKYLLKVAGYTATGVGKYSDIVEFDTCLVEAPDVIVYYFENVPFVQSPVAPIKKPSGVMIEALEKSLLLCAQTCSSFKRNITLIYRHLNISSTKDVINLTQTLKGAFMPILDPRSIIPGAEFVAIATSPGFVLLQVPDSPEVLLKQNEEIFLKTIINSMSVFILYFVINVLSGAIFFLCEPQSAEKRRVCYSLSGVFEGVYLAIMTSTTVGYGDKKPLSGKGRIFIIFWTLLGIVITGVCVGNVASAISSAKLSAMKSHFPNEAVIGVEDSIEYEWASKKMVVDNTTKYFSYEEVVQSLESGAVKYAIFDQYAVEPFKQRLSSAGIFVAHTYANNFGKMGVVLTGKLSLLSTCVNQFIQANQKVVENALEKYKMNLATKAGNLSLPTNSSSREKYQPPDKNANLISFNAPLFRKFFIFFLISLGALYFIGTIYELVRRRLLKSKSNRVKSTLELKLALKQDLLKLALEFEIEYAEMVEGLLKKTDDILFRHCKELLDLTKSCSKMYGVNFKYVNISDLGVPLDLIAEYREEMNNLPKVPWWIKFREAFFRKFLWLKIRIEPIGKFFYDLL